MMDFRNTFNSIRKPNLVKLCLQRIVLWTDGTQRSLSRAADSGTAVQSLLITKSKEYISQMQRGTEIVSTDHFGK